MQIQEKCCIKYFFVNIWHPPIPKGRGCQESPFDGDISEWSILDIVENSDVIKIYLDINTAIRYNSKHENKCFFKSTSMATFNPNLFGLFLDVLI